MGAVSATVHRRPRLQANIVQVVQEYVPLKRAGTTYKGLCPFHSEKTPSFHVNPEKGFFHCFGCGVGGDVFKFLELHEKVGFQDAVRMLAQKFGVSLPEPGEGTGDDGRRDAGLREALLKIHEIAAEYFREQLAVPPGRAPASSSPTGSQRENRRAARTGLCAGRPGWAESAAAEAGLSRGQVLQSGLVVQRDNGEIVDRFSNRLMVPICRDTGSVIAFGGRSWTRIRCPSI